MYPEPVHTIPSVISPTFTTNPLEKSTGEPADLDRLVDELRSVYRVHNLEWIDHCDAMDRLRARLSRKKRPTLIPATAPTDLSLGASSADATTSLGPTNSVGLVPLTASGRTTRRTANSTTFGVGDAVTDAQFDIVLAHLGTADQKDPNIRAMKTTAVIPDMALLPEHRQKIIEEQDGDMIVENPIEFYELCKPSDELGQPTEEWTKEEQEAFETSYTAQPKQFGWIASQVRTKSRAECVLHYYRTKRERKYRNLHLHPLAVAEGKPREIRGKRARKTALKTTATAGTNQLKPKSKPSAEMVTGPQSDGEGEDDAIEPVPPDSTSSLVGLATNDVLRSQKEITPDVSKPSSHPDSNSMDLTSSFPDKPVYKPSSPEIALSHVARRNSNSETTPSNSTPINPSPVVSLELDVPLPERTSSQASSDPQTNEPTIPPPPPDQAHASPLPAELTEAEHQQVYVDTRPSHPAASYSQNDSSRHSNQPRVSEVPLRYNLSPQPSFVEDKVEELAQYIEPPLSNVPQKRKLEVTGLEKSASGRALHPASQAKLPPMLNPQDLPHTTHTLSPIRTLRVAEAPLGRRSSGGPSTANGSTASASWRAARAETDPLEAAREPPKQTFVQTQSHSNARSFRSLLADSPTHVSEPAHAPPPENKLKTAELPVSRSSMQIRNLLNDNPVEPSVAMSNMDASAWFGSNSPPESPPETCRADSAQLHRSPTTQAESASVQDDYRMPSTSSQQRPPSRPRIPDPLPPPRSQPHHEMKNMSVSYPRKPAEVVMHSDERFGEPSTPPPPPPSISSREHARPMPSSRKNIQTFHPHEPDMNRTYQSPYHATLPTHLKQTRVLPPSERPRSGDYYGIPPASHPSMPPHLPSRMHSPNLPPPMYAQSQGGVRPTGGRLAPMSSSTHPNDAIATSYRDPNGQIWTTHDPPPPPPHTTYNYPIEQGYHRGEMMMDPHYNHHHHQAPSPHLHHQHQNHHPQPHHHHQDVRVSTGGSRSVRDSHPGPIENEYSHQHHGPPKMGGYQSR